MDTNEKKKKRFIKGLRAILYREVTSHHTVTFDDVVKQAQWAENDHEKVVTEIKEKRLKNNPQADKSNQDKATRGTETSRGTVRTTSPSRINSSSSNGKEFAFNAANDVALMIAAG